jgi:hypothetical protein
MAFSFRDACGADPRVGTRGGYRCASAGGWSRQGITLEPILIGPEPSCVGLCGPSPNFAHQLPVAVRSSAVPAGMRTPRMVVTIPVAQSRCPVAVAGAPARSPMAAIGSANPANAFRILCRIRRGRYCRANAAHWHGGGRMDSKTNCANSDACGHRQLETCFHIILHDLT